MIEVVQVRREARVNVGDDKGHSLVWEGDDDDQLLRKKREMTNSCKILHLVAEKRYEPLHPVVKLVVAEGHRVKVQEAVEPALQNIQLLVTFGWSVAFLHTIVLIQTDCCDTTSSSE